MEDKFEKTLFIEGHDGRKRAVTFDIGSRLVKHSKIIDGDLLPPTVHPALDGLSMAQIEGLGLEFLLRP